MLATSRGILIASYLIFATIVDHGEGFGFQNRIPDSRLCQLTNPTHTSVFGRANGYAHSRLVESCIRSKASNQDTISNVDLETSIKDSILEKFNEIHCEDSGKDAIYTYKDLISFTMKEFKPLGCTAEESLNVGPDGSKHVFISKVVAGGNAEGAGLQVGDAIVGVSGSFDSVIDVVGEPLERVKNLIGARNDGDDLVIIVIRGSDIMSKHDSALVDMCVLPDNDKQIDKCIESMYEAESSMRMQSYSEPPVKECDDGDSDCMLDALFDVWSDDMGLDKEEEIKEEKVEKKKPAPWSSRSSPSGTYVRDPKTGKMVNIDE